MSNYGSYMMGSFVGSILAIFLFSYLLEFVIVRRVVDDPVKGKVGSVIAVLAILCTLAMVRREYDGTHRLVGLAGYFAGALIFGTLGYVRGTKVRDEQFDHADQPDLEDTFK